MSSDVPTSQLLKRYAQVREGISRLAKAHQRRSENLRLLAVSKTHAVASIEELYGAGQREFAENYAQELEKKAQQLNALPITWVFIGALQANKIKRIVRYADEIQSAASRKHLELIARYAAEFNKVPFPVYLEVNAGEESAKSGVNFAELSELAAYVTEHLPELTVQGIMAIPPQFPPSAAAQQQELYRLLRQTANSIGLGKLSLGMSDDWEAAIAAGSDCLRLGTALFGSRNYEKEANR